jgi:hypothetical protein
MDATPESTPEEHPDAPAPVDAVSERPTTVRPTCGGPVVRAGSVEVRGDDVLTLPGTPPGTPIDDLRGVTEIQYDLTIFGTHLTDLTALSCLEKVGGRLVISENTDMLTLDGLESLVYVGATLELEDNRNLTDMKALGHLTHVLGGANFGHAIYLWNNRKLAAIDLSGIREIHGSLHVQGNDLIVDLAGLANLTTIDAQLTIENNASLASLHGLEGLSSLAKSPPMVPGVAGLIISDNRTLPACDVKSFYDRLVDQGFSGLATLERNLGTCP